MLLNLVWIALAITLLCVLFLYWPRQMKPGQQLDSKTLFAEKLVLLEDALAQGELSEADFALAAAELKAQFLAPLPDAKQLGGQQRRGTLAALLLIVLGTALTYGLTGQYRELQHWEQAQQNLTAFGERALLGKGEPLSEEELSQFALGLRTKLATSGDDAVAWFVLGRIWFSQGQVQEAIEAFEKALTMTPERTNLLISYAQALLVESSEESVQKAARSLGIVLGKEPGNVDALSMLALIAEQRGDTKEAVAAWQVLLEQLPANDPRQSQIVQRLQKLEQGEAVPSQNAVAASDSKADAPAAAGPVIVLELTIPADVAAANAGATLFVFARATEGMPLPVAAQKLALSAGTLQIRLDDSHAMQPGWNLSAVKAVTVGARISRSGSATPDPADVQLKSEPLTLQAGEQQIRLSFSAQP